MEKFSESLPPCAGKSSVTDEFPAKGSVTRSFDVFFDLRLNNRLSKHSRRWLFERPSRSLWRRCDGTVKSIYRKNEMRYEINAIAADITVIKAGVMASHITGKLSCLFNSLFRLTAMKKQRFTSLSGPLWGDSIGDSIAFRARYAESVSIALLPDT